MAKTQILEYTIYLTDQAVVDAYNAQLDAGAGPGELLRYYSPAAAGEVYGVYRAPRTGAAVEFAAPFQLDTATFLAPSTRSPWFNNGANFPTDVATFTRKSGGWFGIPVLFPTTTKFYWVGRFAYSAPSHESPEPPPVPPPVLKARRWIDGFETGDIGSVQTGEGGSAGNPSMARGASRTHDGFGYACRDQSSNVRTHSVMENRGGGTSDQDWSWDRIYIRPRRYPASGEVELWACTSQQSSGASGAEGMRLRMSVDGRLLIYSRDNSSNDTLVATGPILALDTWVKVDLVCGYEGVSLAWSGATAYVAGDWVTSGGLYYKAILAGTNHVPPNATYWTNQGVTGGRLGSLRVYVNSVQVAEASRVSVISQIRSTTNRHETSKIGPASANTAEIDFDDWVSFDVPVMETGYWGAATGIGARIADYATLETQTDFLAGTHMVRVYPSAAVTTTNWTGAWQRLLKRLIDNLDANNRLTCSTTGQLLELTADVTPTTLYEGATGIASIVVGTYYTRSAGVVGNDTIGGSAGLDTDGDGVVDDTKAFSASVVPPASGVFGWRTGFYDAAGEDQAPKLLSLSLKYTHGADAIQRSLEALTAVVEMIGTFGVEDLPPDSASTLAFPVADPHFAHQAASSWARTSGPRFGTTAVIAGTYVGTGAPLDLTFPLPLTWIRIRRTAGTATQQSGFGWMGAGLAGYIGIDQKVVPWILAGGRQDRTFAPAAVEDAQEQRWLVTLMTADDKVNESGITYQYTAICDPAARYCRSTQFAPPQSGYPRTIALRDAQFTPLVGLFHLQDRGSGSGSTLYLKTPLHAAGEATQLAAALTTDFVDFGLGSISARTNMGASGIEGVAALLFRNDDGNGASPMVQYATYTGDGTGNRTIALTPLFGLRPLFAFIAGDTAGSQDRLRDASHTGTTSTDTGSGTAVAANGIRGGGVDAILVGSDLNVLNAVYHVFAIPGSATGTADGWSVAGTFYVSEPDSALDPLWDEPVEVSPGDSTPGGGEGATPVPEDLEDDLDDVLCVEPTTRIMNLALQRIGVSKQVTTLLTQATQEAVAIRTAYDETLLETLRAHPWPFATRYLALTLAAGSSGSPANSEWQYAYQVPDDCVFPRRIVAARGRAVDPTPPPFREAGGLIFTNQANAVLEYTSRVHCPALNGDATFRSAWGWRLAGELAPVLTRMPDKQVHCLEMWGATIQQAMRFLRLGAPGLRPATDPTDPDAGSLTLKLQVINLALIRIGAKTIADLSTEQSREAIAALLVYEDELRAGLRDYAWPFATRYADASLDTPTLTLVGGTSSVPYTPDWYFAYRMPTDSIGVRRLVKSFANGGLGRFYDPNPIGYRIGSDAAGLLIYTNEEDAVIEYTIRPTDVLEIADPLFKSAFAWRLAAATAQSIIIDDPEKEEQTGQAPKNENRVPRRSEGGTLQLHRVRMEKAKWAWGMYERELSIAQRATANESQPEKSGDADWILGRE